MIRKNVLEDCQEKKTALSRHAMRSCNLQLRALTEQNPVGRRLLGRPKMKWKIQLRGTQNHWEADRIGRFWFWIETAG